MINGIFLHGTPSDPPVPLHHVLHVQPTSHHLIQTRIEVVDRIFGFVQIIELECIIARCSIVKPIPEITSIIMEPRVTLVSNLTMIF